MKNDNYLKSHEGSINDVQKIAFWEKLFSYLGLCLLVKKGSFSKVVLVAFWGWLAWVPCGIASETGIQIGQSNDQQMESLVEQLLDSDIWTRWRAASTLGDIDSEAAVPALIEVLQDSNTDPRVRLRAASALGKIGSDAAVPVLIEVLQDSDIDTGIRLGAASALGEIGSDAAVPALIEVLLQDSDTHSLFHFGAAFSLEEIGSDVTAPALAEALQDSNIDTGIRQNAASALGKIGSDAAVPALIEALQDSDIGPRVHRRAASALKEIGSDTAVAALIEVLQDSNTDPHIRHSTASVLGRIGSDTAVAALIEVLQDSNTDPRVHQSTAFVLGEIGSDAAVPALAEVLQDSNTDPRVRQRAASTLEDMGSEATVPALIEALRNSEHPVSRGHLMRILQKYRDPSITVYFLEQISNLSETKINRYRAINAFTQQQHLENLASSSNSLKILEDLALQEEEDNFIRYGALLILSSVNTRESLNLLDAHQSEFLALIEANYTTNLPFYVPKPINTDQTEPPNPFDESNIVIAALDPYQAPANSLPTGIMGPIIPSIPQGANPGETRQDVTARLDGKPAVCGFPWVARNWRRCSS